MNGDPEFLVSIGIPEEGFGIAREVAMIATLAHGCAARLRYFELIYVIEERHRSEVEEYAALLATIGNLRIVFVRNGTSYYQRRRIAAATAIGDVVVLACLAELGAIDLAEMARRCFLADRVVLAERSARASLSIFHPVVRALSGHRVNSRDMRSIAFPRATLVQTLERETATIDLRFEPKRGERYERIAAARPKTRIRSGIGHRLLLVSEIVSGAASKYLRAYALLSLVTLICALLYGLYAVVVVTTFRHVEPGWFTTNFVQSASIGFLALGFAIFSLGLARLLERQDGGSGSGIVDEIGNTNFFSSAPTLNVDLDRESLASVPAGVEAA